MVSGQKEVYKVESVHKAFYTGGDLEWTEDGEKLFCQCGSSIQVLNVNEGNIEKVIGSEGTESDEKDLITTFVLSKDSETVVSAHKSGLFKLWDVNECKLIQHWRVIHKGPVAKLALSDDCSLLASGGSDSSIRIWDLRHHACTHNLQGVQGVISVLKFYKDADGKQLVFGAGDDTTIKAWNLATGGVSVELRGHYSKVTSLGFDTSGKYVFSCGRDKVLMLWDMKSGNTLKTLPLFESAEAAVLLPDKFTIPGTDVKVEGGVYVATGGDKGIIRFWDTLNAVELFVQTNSLIRKSTEEGGLLISKLLFNERTSSFAVASAEHNIIIHDIDSFSCKKQFIGFSDEILEIILVGPEENYMVVATNSADIKAYNLETMNCQLLQGHTDLVVSLASSPVDLCIFASASKDNSIRVWKLVDDTAYCVCSGVKHNSSVTSVALSQTSLEFIVSVSEDTTVKLWGLPKKFVKGSNEPEILNVKHAKIAHEKDINCVVVSPNDKLIATASLDKTAKLWSSDDLSLLGVLKGHKRGIWSCTFSPIDQVLLTTSADTTLKIWSLADLSCLKTFEGHDSSVLRGHFLSRGTQLLSAGGDGLIKLWSIKTSECTASFDKHEAKIWALAVLRNESKIVSGGCDSMVVVWRDATEELKLEKAAIEQEKMQKEQELANLLQAENLLSALKLALTLDRPATILKIIQDVMKKDSNALSGTVKSLEYEEKQKLLKCATSWNANSKYCYPAQLLVSILLDEIATGKLKVPYSTVEKLIPFTERHFNRLTQLLQDLHFVEYTKTRLQPAIGNV